MRARLVLAATLIVALAGCASTPVARPSGTNDLHGSVIVFAAASLTAPFTLMKAAFEAEHPGTTITLNFAGSSDLVTQIIEGAPADVFASADTRNMARLTEVSLADAPVDFASNTLTIVVPPGNPGGIESFDDLARTGVSTVVCAPQVPCGAAAVAVEAATGVALTPVSEEFSVTDVLGKVSSRAADAGLVYVTDALAAGSAVEGIAFPESAGIVNTYPIAALTDSRNPALAAAFAVWVASAPAQKILRVAGFGRP
ncbi:molybdate ABC transporter substrate-binding protein [Cryobacterium psychrophilum]|uniref:Molybdate ABC transporter substrate-binding protein n=1 Tax=Cryobacterium psychrophilum TaxID=41988 RepID=A0A4Y8KMQ7_9MICO|nr:molybdate ABC transporter substrate-binding protein [Cryobacterium psychrophilum]TDW30542.1 molybdate transport system substrate-binding protein [Cryobacterium psychrophilum]TFD76293.1 molybdate ABC transporter substrate-binding protein [Cryobacterium psychrophilum]